MAASSNQSDIIKLPESVINKIAAGEVIQRPFNIVKELIENSLDAEATNILVICKEGGLSYIKIVDNGSGIKKGDFALLCQRHATSKIKTFEDLFYVRSFGFRGEAMASISQIANVTVISKHRDTDFAYCANYSNGQMVYDEKSENPRVCAGNQGTQITVDDIFYNNSIKKSVFNSKREEYGKICSVVGRYAIQFCSSVSFTCKRDFEAKPDILTQKLNEKITVIESVFNFKQPQNLKEFQYSDQHGFEISGVASLSTFNSKKYIFIFFVNNRLVDCNSLKLALSAVYSEFISKNQHPFIYISLSIDPTKIDVNVHPCKQEIVIDGQATVVSNIQEFFKKFLLENTQKQDVSSQLWTNISIENIFQGMQKTSENNSTSISDKIKSISASNKTILNSSNRISDIEKENLSPKYNQAVKSVKFDTFKAEKVYPNRQIRKDYREQSLDNYLNNSGLSISINTTTDESAIHSPEIWSLSIVKQPRVLTLDSVSELKLNINQNMSEDLKNLFQKLIFIGPVHNNRLLIQYNVNLYIFDVFLVCSELFYQIILFNFGSFNYWKLKNPFNFSDILFKNDMSVEFKQKYKNFIDKAAMLLDYYSLKITEEGYLTHLPQLLKNFTINLSLLPIFLKKLVIETDWGYEKSCLDKISQTIAWLYASSIVTKSVTTDGNNSQFRKDVETGILPLLKNIFVPQKKLLYNGGITLITSLPDLYKIFERC